MRKDSSGFPHFSFTDAGGRCQGLHQDANLESNRSKADTPQGGCRKSSASKCTCGRPMQPGKLSYDILMGTLHQRGPAHGLQVEIVRFRTDAKSVGDVIVERAADLVAAAVVRHLCLSIPSHSCQCATGVMGVLTWQLSWRSLSSVNSGCKSLAGSFSRTVPSYSGYSWAAAFGSRS